MYKQYDLIYTNISKEETFSIFYQLHSPFPNPHAEKKIHHRPVGPPDRRLLPPPDPEKD